MLIIVDNNCFLFNCDRDRDAGYDHDRDRDAGYDHDRDRDAGYDHDEKP